MTPKNTSLIACTIGNMVCATPMIYTVFGLFLIPISTEFNWPRSSVSAVLLILAVVGALSYPVIGRAIDRFGARAVLIPGIAAFAATVPLIAATPQNIWIFYAIFALIGVTSAIPSSAMYTKVIAGWFDETRGFALGIAGGGGNGVGAALSPIIVAGLILHFGWRGAFVGIGAMIAVLGLPALFFLLRDPPQQQSADTSDAAGLTMKEAARTGTFWILLIALGIGAGCMTAVFGHVVPILLDRGIETPNAVTVLVTFSITTALWQMGIGILLDKLPKPWLGVPFYLAAVAGLILLAQSTDQSVLICAGVLMGLGLGTQYGMLPYLLSRYFGFAHYGAILGVAYGAITLFQGMTPLLMDIDYDLSGSYENAVTVVSISMVVCALLLTRLKPVPALHA